MLLRFAFVSWSKCCYSVCHKQTIIFILSCIAATQDTDSVTLYNSCLGHTAVGHSSHLWVNHREWPESALKKKNSFSKFPFQFITVEEEKGPFDVCASVFLELLMGLKIYFHNINYAYLTFLLNIFDEQIQNSLFLLFLLMTIFYQSFNCIKAA